MKRIISILLVLSAMTGAAVAAFAMPALAASEGADLTTCAIYYGKTSGAGQVVVTPSDNFESNCPIETQALPNWPNPPHAAPSPRQ